MQRWMVRFYKIQYILAGNYSDVSGDQNNTPIITSIEVNTLFTLQNSTESFLRMPNFTRRLHHRPTIQGDNQVGGENNFRFLLFPAWKWNPFNVTILQYMIAVEETEILLLTNIFGLWVEKLQLTFSRQSSFEMTFERLVQK